MDIAPSNIALVSNYNLATHTPEYVTLTASECRIWLDRLEALRSYIKTARVYAQSTVDILEDVPCNSKAWSYKKKRALDTTANQAKFLAAIHALKSDKLVSDYITYVEEFSLANLKFCLRELNYLFGILRVDTNRIFAVISQVRYRLKKQYYETSDKDQKRIIEQIYSFIRVKDNDVL